MWILLPLARIQAKFCLEWVTSWAHPSQPVIWPQFWSAPLHWAANRVAIIAFMVPTIRAATAGWRWVINCCSRRQLHSNEERSKNGCCRLSSLRCSTLLIKVIAKSKTKKPLLRRRRGFEFGRRNWTRTNDPHHVKVVL